MQKLSPIHQEELERLKLQVAGKKAAISKEIDKLEAQIKSLEAVRNGITNDRLRLLAMEKQINQLRREYMSKQENQFFDAMRLDLELEEQIKALADRDKLTAKVVREFVIKLEATK